MGTHRAQHIEALAQANEVRHWLSTQRREIKTGAAGVALWMELCQSRDERLKSVTVLEFLMWLPGVGKTRARQIIAQQFAMATLQSEARPVPTLDAATAERICQAAASRPAHEVAV
jgi:hypothetical protein